MALNITKPQLLTFKEKYGDTHYLVSSTNDYIAVLHFVAAQRLKEGYWYEDNKTDQTDLFSNTDSQFEIITRILAMDITTDHYMNALNRFMKNRVYDGYEYEGFELETFEEYKK